jgi:hypothetical protein
MPIGLGGDAVDKLALFKDVINVAKKPDERTWKTRRASQL